MHRVLLIISGLLLLGSCRQKDIDMGVDRVSSPEVRFDWQYAPDASPEGMTVYFFPLDAGGKVWRFDIAGRSGGRVALPPGNYSLLAYNNDTEGVRILTGARPELFQGEISDDSRPITALYSGEVGRVEITAAEGQTIICSPRKISTTYTVRILRMEGPTEKFISASLRLHGPAKELNLLTASPTDVAATVSADFPRSDETPLETRFESLRPLQPLTLEIILTSASRRQFRQTFDVTPQLANNQNPFDVIILIDTLKLPEEDTSKDDSDVGMTVGVDGWVETNIDYKTDLKL